jgi:translocation and assembly module TamB
LKFFRRLLQGIGLTLLFAASLILGVLLHLDTRAGRRAVTVIVNESLAPLFVGRIRLVALQHVGLTGVRGIDAQILGEDGQVIIDAHGVSARADVLALGAQALTGQGPIEILLRDTTVDHADVSLDGNEVPAMARAFALRSPGPKEPDDAAKGRGVRILIPHAHIKHAWVHGHFGSVPRLDVDVTKLDASLEAGGPRTTIDAHGVELEARELPMHLGAHLHAEAGILVPSPRGNPVGLWMHAQGQSKGVPLWATLELDGERLDAQAHVAPTDDATLRSALPFLPLYARSGVHAEAHGDLPRLDLTAQGSAGGAGLDVLGSVNVQAPLRIEANADVREVDLRIVAKEAPASSLAAQVRATCTIMPEGPEGDFEVSVLPGVVANNAVPAADLRGTFSVSSQGPTVHANGTIAEAGAPIALEADLVPELGGSVLTVSADSRAKSLEGIKRIGPVAQGSATVFARAELHTGTSKIAGNARVTTSGIAREAISVEHTSSQVTVSGTLKAPRLALRSEASGLALGPLRFARAHIASEGDASTQHTLVVLDAAQGGPDVAVESDVSFAPTLGLRSTVVQVRRGTGTVSIETAKIDAGDGEVSVQGARVLGMGAPATFDARVYKGGFSMRGRSRGLNIERLTRMLDPDAPVAKGRVSFDVDLIADAGRTEGHAIVDVSGAEFAKIQQGKLHLDAVIEGTKARADVEASAANLGTAHLFTTDLELGGKNILLSSSWRRAKGRVDLEGAVDLGKLQAMLPEAREADVSGTAVIKASLARATHGEEAPAAQIAVNTASLVVCRGDVRLSGINLSLVAESAPVPQRNAATLVIEDAHGPLVTAELRADELRPLALLGAGPELRALLEASPFDLKVIVPARDLSDLPDALSVRGLRGNVEANIDVHGPVTAPRVQFGARTTRLALRGAGVTAPTNAELRGTYDGAKLSSTATVTSREMAVLSAEITGNAPLEVLLHPVPVEGVQPEFPWDADVRATLRAFPLDTITQLERAGVRGALNGTVTLTGLHKDAALVANITPLGLGIGDATYNSGALKVRLDNRELRGTLALQEGSGSLSVEAQAASRWGAALAPTILADEGIEARLQSKNLQIAPARAFAGDALTELRGLLNADARLSFARGKPAVVQGTLGVRDVALQVTAFPVEFHGGKATLSVAPDGMIRLSDAALYSHSGRITAEGEAKLDGLRLDHAKGSIDIPKGQPLPLDLNGGNLGDVYGKALITAKGSADGNLINVDVQVPTLRVDLPLSTTRTVRDLDPLPNIQIGYVNASGAFVSLRRRRATEAIVADPRPSTRIDVAITLGKEVEVRRGSQVKVAMSGRPVLHLAEATTMTGEVRLENTSTIELQGKKFEIERGTINFGGQELGNPVVYLTAGWTATDGTRVYADFVGPLKTGKVTLRSEPARPKSEILSLILFGHADGSSSTPYAQKPASGSSTAGSAAGGLASEGLNKGLEELTGLEIATKVDTSKGPNPRPGVEVQIARSVSLELAFVLGTPPPGTNPDKTFATIDWRFWRQWSLETTFGDQGSSYADLVWQYRY